MKTKYPFICFAIIFLLPMDAMSHSGRTNRYGGHNDYKHGGYHNHNGGYSSSGSIYSRRRSYNYSRDQSINNRKDVQPERIYDDFESYTKIVKTTYKCNGVIVTDEQFKNCVPNKKDAGEKIKNNQLYSYTRTIPVINTKNILPERRPKVNLPSTYKIAEVLDADIIQPSGKNSKIILYGVDAPVEGQPFHDEAENMLRKLVHKKKVTAKIYSKSKDGADIAVIFVGGKNVNELMVESGYAWIYRDSCSEAFCDDWLEREEEAKLQKIGLWNDPGRLPPWVWKSK